MSVQLNVGDLVTFNFYYDDRISFTCRKKVIGVGIITQRHYNSLFEHFDYSVVFGTYEMCSVPRVWLVKMDQPENQAIYCPLEEKWKLK